MIQHISFYKDGKRNIVIPDKNGKFKVIENSKTITSVPKARYITASEFVNHPSIRECDPTITLDTGEKLRVYYAGNSFIPLVHPSIVLAKYDKKTSNSLKKTTLQKKLDSMKKTAKERESHTTQPMSSPAPIVPPYSGPVKINKKVKVSNSPPQKKISDPDDPFSNLIDEWFGGDEYDSNEDPNDGLYPFTDEDE